LLQPGAINNRNTILDRLILDHRDLRLRGGLVLRKRPTVLITKVFLRFVDLGDYWLRLGAGVFLGLGFRLWLSHDF
jgi:hypothetical protein